jgi:hypothetical protein
MRQPSTPAQRIARLRPEIGEHLDAVEVPFYLVRDVAYGFTQKPRSWPLLPSASREHPAAPRPSNAAPRTPSPPARPWTLDRANLILAPRDRARRRPVRIILTSAPAALS